MIIGKIAVVHEGFIHAGKRVGAARMPDAPFGRITLMRDPAVGVEILQQIILCQLLGIADDLQYHHVAPVRQDKGFLFAQGGIVLLIQAEAILEKEKKVVTEEKTVKEKE